jgi:hypothetical protein
MVTIGGLPSGVMYPLVYITPRRLLSCTTVAGAAPLWLALHHCGWRCTTVAGAAPTTTHRICSISQTSSAAQPACTRHPSRQSSQLHSSRAPPRPPVLALSSASSALMWPASRVLCACSVTGCPLSTGTATSSTTTCISTFLTTGTG